jgi:hypothetical protein
MDPPREDLLNLGHMIPHEPPVMFRAVQACSVDRSAAFKGWLNVAEEWQPATDLESRLIGALQSGAGQEEYFRLLAGAEVVVPLAPETAEQVLAGETQPTWPTSRGPGARPPPKSPRTATSPS